MAEPLPPADAIPAAQEAPKRRFSAAQLIWLVPLLAVLVVGWLVLQEWLAAGPTITIRFRSAEGLEAGKTRVKYREVDIGQVQQIRLAPDRKGVLVVAQMSRDAKPLLVEDTKFWVVRARLAGGEVSGLGTLLTGSYIGIAGGRSGSERREFEGLENPPVLDADESGREFRLNATTLGSLEVGSPLFLRRVRVGQVLGTDLDPDGRRISLRVFVRAPWDRLVTANTRFWHDSGVDVSFDGSGLRFHTESLQSVLIGGISLETPPETRQGPPGPPAEAGAAFTLFENAQQALRRADWETIDYTATFDDSVRGLAAGAAVEFKGFVIGEVAAVDIQFDADLSRFVFPVRMRIYRDLAASVSSAAVGAAPSAGAQGAGRFPLEQLLSPRSIERGLRAQLRTANLLTGQRYVAIDLFPEQRGRIAAARVAERVIPTAPDTFGELQASIARIVRQLEAVPFDRIAADLRRTLARVDGLVQSLDGTLKQVNGDVLPGARQTLDEARRAIADVRALAAQGEPLPSEIGAALRDVGRAADALRQLADTIERQPESLLRGRRGSESGAGGGGR